MSPVSRTVPSAWMFTTGDEFTNKDDIVKKPGGWYKKHPNGYEELIHVLRDIGNTAAAIASLTNQADGTYSAPQTLSFTVTFDEAVVVDTTDGTPYIEVYTETADKYALAYASGSGTTDLVFSGDVTGMADGTLVVTEEITLNGGTILDSDAGNWLDNDFPSGYTQPAIVMSTAVIDSVANQADGTYSAPQTLSFTTAFDEAVVVDTIGGMPHVLVYTETADRYALSYASGSGTTDLVFSGDASGMADGTLNVDEQITLGGGTLSDASSNPVDVNFNDGYTQPAINVSTAVIDSVANPPDGTYADTDTLTFTVTYDEAVTVVTTSGTPSIEVSTGGDSVAIPYASGSGTTDLVFSGTPTGIADGTLNVDEQITLNGGTLSDASSNPADVYFNDGYTQPAITMSTP